MKRLLSLVLVLTMVLSLIPATAVAAEDPAPKTAVEAAAEMTWGVNLADLYMGETPEDLRRQESTTGYDDYNPKEIYDMCVALWFWDGTFEWLQFYPTEKRDSYQVSVKIPNYDAAKAAENLYSAFLTVRCGDKTGGQDYRITLSDCRIIGADGTVLKETYGFGPNWDGVMTAQGTTVAEGDENGWHWGFGTQENNWQDEIAWYAKWNESTMRSENGADPKYNGATFTATLTVDRATLQPTKNKVEYYYCVNRTLSDYKDLVDTYMAQGINVFRLPVTWTWFTRNDGEFTIDPEWLEAVQGTVDYILSKGAYCILNTHDDYLQFSYVAESDGNGGYTNFKWEDQWMEDRYKEYVDARFAAIWKQIAEYFKDYPDHLIFESMNEPSMNWYSGVDFDNWLIRQSNRINGMNELFVDTVRATGGNNATRILCLPTNNYCSHEWLDEVVIPEDSDYMMVQIHCYANNMGSEWTSESAMNTMFSNIAAFKNANPKVGLIVGEAGISHSLANRADPEGTSNAVRAFVGRAADIDMPFLWWEDFFAVYDGIEADQTHWIYDKLNGCWREEVLSVIKDELNIVPADPDPDPEPGLGVPEATGYYHAHGQDLIDPEGNVCLIKGISFGNVIFGNPSHYEDGPIDDHDENSYIEIAQMGLDHVRFEMNYGLFEDDNNPLVTVDANGDFVYHPDRVKESGFEWIDMNLEWAKAAGVNILLQIELPQGGYQASTDVMAPGPTYEIANGGKNLWIDMQVDGTPDHNGENYKLLQERLAYMWQLIAARYANEPAVVGYGLLNEPVVPQVKVNGEPNAEATRAQLRDLYQHIVDSIRTVDENHAIFTQCLIMWFDPDDYNSTDWNLMDLDETQVLLDDDNIVYQFHFFEPFEYTHQGADWMPQYKDMVTNYPSDNLVISDWSSKGLSGANAGQSENGWTYYETEWVTSGTIYGTAYNCAQPQVNLANLGSGDVWFDDIIVKRKDSQGNITVLYSYDFADGLGSFASYWFQNSGTYEWDAEVGRTGTGAIHAASSNSGQWDNGNSWDNFYLDPDYTYQISGWVRGGNGSQFPEFSYMYADNALPMGRDYVENMLKKYAKFGEDNNVPLFSGSWGFYYTCYDRGGEEYFKDVTELYEEYNISSNYHSYHDSTFGLYLSESWQPREERNEPLYNCLCKYYGKVEPTPTPDPEPDPGPEPDPAPEFTSAVMQDGTIVVHIDGICEGLVMAAVYTPDGKLVTILSMQVTPAFIAAMNPVVHLDGVPELEDGCVVKVFFVDEEGALQCAPTDDLNKTE